MVTLLRVLAFSLLISGAGGLRAATVKTEIVEETEHDEVKVFCSKKSEQEARSVCEKWLTQQSKTLSSRLLTSYCSACEIVTQDASCLYRVTGQLKYVLRKYRTETEKNP